MYGDRMLFEQRGQGFDMVTVLMRDKDRANVTNAFANAFQRLCDGAAAASGIDQYAIVSGTDKHSVAARAGKECVNGHKGSSNLLLHHFIAIIQNECGSAEQHGDDKQDRISALWFGDLLLWQKTKACHCGSQCV